MKNFFNAVAVVVNAISTGVVAGMKVVVENKAVFMELKNDKQFTAQVLAGFNESTLPAAMEEMDKLEDIAGDLMKKVILKDVLEKVQADSSEHSEPAEVPTYVTARRPSSHNPRFLTAEEAATQGRH